MQSAGLSLEKRPFLKGSLMAGAYHGLVAWGGLSLSYCAYKAYIRWLTSSFPLWLKWEIKSSFPLAIAIFASIYFIYHLKARRHAGAREYALMLSAYALCVNVLALGFSAPVMLVLNGSLPMIALLLVLLMLVKQVPYYLGEMAKRLGIEPQTINLVNEAKMAAFELSAGTRGIPSRLIAAGTGLIILCTLFIAFKQRSAASHAASIAWVLLLSGVLVKLIRSLRDRGEE